jgi:hypothetical protein
MDSADYLAAARSLLDGRGLELCSGSIYNRWPPLFPVTIAGLSAVGLEPLTAIGYLNALAFGALILVTGALLAQLLHMRVLALAGALAVALSWQQVLWAIHALTETVFTLLIVAFVWVLWLVIQRPTRLRWVLLVVLASAAALQRYLGLAAIPTGFVVLLLASRWRAALGFAVSAALLPGLWLLRNLTLADTLFGEHGGRHPWTLDYLEQAANRILNWFWPPRLAQGGTLTGAAAVDLALILGLVALLLILYYRRFPSERLRDDPGWVVVIALVIFAVMLLWAAAGLPQPWDSQRLTAPLYPLFFVLIFWSLDRGGLWLRAVTRSRWPAWVLTALIYIWLLAPADKIAREFNLLTNSDGWRGFTAQELRASPLVRWEQPALITDPIYANKTAPICILAERPVQTLPLADVSAALAALPDNLTLIILPDSRRYVLSYSLDDLASTFEIETLVPGEGDTGVYRLTRRG